MNTHSEETLDTFDIALLAQLQQAVVSRSAAPRRVARRRVVGLSAAVAATTATIVALTTVGSPSAAFAVDRSPGGAITIRIHQLSDASGLQRDLATFGITAEVNYQASSVTSEPAPLKAAPNPGSGQTPLLSTGSASSTTTLGGASLGGAPSTSACGDPSHPALTATLDGGDYVVTIPSDSVLRQSDSVLKITTSGDLQANVAGLMASYTVKGASCGFGTASAAASAG